MQTSPTLLTASTLAISVGLATVAQAEDTVVLSFDLAPSPLSETQSIPATPAIASVPETIAPLPIPPEATRPPLGNAESASSFPSAYGGVDALALAGRSDGEATTLPAPPISRIAPSQPSLATLSQDESASDIQPLEIPEPIDVAIQFDLVTEPELQASQPIDTTIGSTVDTALNLGPLFAGGADSLVARAVGSAEGTRTPEGQRTPAYFGHVDPGNAAWNLGSFSYQHGAISPEAADRKQLQRLQSQAEQLQAKAADHDLTLSTAALLNGIDLANQAPMAALDRWGYIERLAQAQQSGLAEDEAIVWARTRAFLDPDTQRWNAPGLGNTLEGISRDQTRRVKAISRALAVHANAPVPMAPELEPTESTEAIDDILLTFTPEVAPQAAESIASEPQQDAPHADERLGAASPPSPQTSPLATADGAIPTTQVFEPLSSKANHSDLPEKTFQAQPFPEAAQP